MLLDILQQEPWGILGLVVLSVLGLYCLRLLATFSDGLFSKCWKQVSAGAIFLIAAQFPIIGSEIGPSNMAAAFVDTGGIMRLTGVVLIIFGLRTQVRIWRMEDIKDLEASKRREQDLEH